MKFFFLRKNSYILFKPLPVLVMVIVKNRYINHLLETLEAQAS